MAVQETLNIPFFTLEYNATEACFLRKLPANAKDLGKGKFLWQGKTLTMPAGNAENKILEQPVIKGKDILALARRGYNPLIKSGPLMADRGDRLMELGLLGGSLENINATVKEKNKGKKQTGDALEIEIILRTIIKPEQWLPLEGLPNHRLYGNRIYEIIPDEVLALFSKRNTMTLCGEKLPAFADNYARLIYVFADELLYKLLAQDKIFIDPSEASLVFYCRSIIEQGVGKAKVFPALKYKNKYYSANALSRYYHRKYLPLKDRWIRQETLEQTGIGPLGCFTNGESLMPFNTKVKDFFSGGGDALKLLSLAKNSGGLETEENYWLKYGKEEEIFSSHLEFLRHWGFGGGIIAEPKKAAPFLAAWLTSLSKLLQKNNAGSEEGRVLVLMPKNFWEQWLVHELPQSKEGPLRVPADRWPGADSIWDPAFRGIGIGFFDDVEKNFRSRTWDILVVIGLDEVPNIETVLRQLESLPCRLRLGVFFSSSGIFGNEQTVRIKSFFNIKGASIKYEKYLIRETGDLFSLPERPLHQPDQKPPEPEENNYQGFGGGRFCVEAKFQNLPVAAFLLEQDEFSLTGKGKCQFIPIEGTLNYKDFTEQEKDYFFFWRSEFRKGRAWESSPAYIFLYARELILRMDAANTKNTSVEKTLDELCRLWTSYREIFPEVLAIFPNWILDFAVIHHTENISEVLSAILAQVSASKNSPLLLLDLYLHKKYIEENNSLEWNDFIPLLKSKYSKTETEISRLFMAAANEALNLTDRALRKYYRKKLLEFFYPLPAVKQNFACFDGLNELAHNDLGYSAYSAEWISYSNHKPFVKFLDSLAAFLEYHIIKTINPENRNNAPYLNPVWKYFCGLDEKIPEELNDLILHENGTIDEPELRLEEEKIIRLREDSDAVMELLKVKNYEFNFEDEGHFEIPVVTDNNLIDKTRPDIVNFITALDSLSLNCIKLLSQGRAQDLKTFARENNTMPELIIDRINEQFLAEYGDLLVENELDQQPIIGEEYRDEVIWALTFQNA